MSRCIIFCLALALICDRSQAGLRDWLDTADDMARGLEKFALFPTDMIFTFLGTRPKPEGLLKRITAESSDSGEIITIISGSHTASNEEKSEGSSPFELVGKLGSKLTSRVDKVQSGIANTLGGVANKLTDKASETLNNMGETVTGGITKGIDGITDRMKNSLGGGLTGLFSGGKKSDDDDEESEEDDAEGEEADVQADEPDKKQTEVKKPKGKDKQKKEKNDKDNDGRMMGKVVSGVTDGVSSMTKGVSNAMNSGIGSIFG